MLSSIQKKFLTQARRKKRKLAIGIVRPEEEVVDSVYQAAGYADLTVVGSKIQGLNCIPTKDDDEASHVIVDLLKQGKIEGFVRAQVKDSYTNKIYREVFKIPKSVKKFCPCIIAKDETFFVIANPSNYNSLTQKDQIEEAEAAIKWMKTDLKLTPKIAVMSTRRPTGKVGVYGLIEEIAKRCEGTARHLRKKGYSVKEYYIEYERAIWEGRNLFIASSGMIGNTWGKGLCYLGGWTYVHDAMLDHGAYYDDCPRNNKDWFWPIVSTVAWVNRGTVKTTR